jgi:hypothetical protein
VRPRPIEEKKNPPGISSADTATPVCATHAQGPDRLVASTNGWQSSAGGNGRWVVLAYEAGLVQRGEVAYEQLRDDA